MLREIGRTRIGEGAPMYVIAEIGLNHGGSLDRALEMVDAAAWAGASAVKLQTLMADGLVAAHCPAPAHVRATSLREFFATFELDAEAHRQIVARARRHGLDVLTTPLDLAALPMLETLGLDGYKIASGDVTHHALIAAAARAGRPLLVSTGMSSLWEITAALDAAREAGGSPIALLHCVSAYPAPAASQNLRAIATLARTFRLPVGLSDHGAGTGAAIPSLALGACLYERHLVLDHDLTAVDRAVSSTPDELRALVAALEQARVALGDGRKVCQPAEAPNVIPSRRGVYARRDLPAGTVLTSDDLAVVRPANGLAPSDAARLIGRPLARALVAGEPFTPMDLGIERAS